MAAGRGKDSGRKGNEKVKGQRMKALQRHDMLQYMEVFISGLLFFFLFLNNLDVKCIVLLKRRIFWQQFM